MELWVGTMQNKYSKNYKMISLNIRPDQYEYLKEKRKDDFEFNLSEVLRGVIDKMRKADKCSTKKQ